MKERKTKIIWLIILILINLIYYSIQILSIPGFLTDDFYIFHIINKNPNQPIALEPHLNFYLFLRPLSYFSFWIDYHLFLDNPVLMKFTSLVIHLFFISILYFLMIEISEMLKREKNYLAIFLLVIIFSFHPDVLYYIKDINNRTELLMICFYSITIFLTVKFINKKINGNIFLVLTTIFFLFSILSKQTSIHFPALLIFIIFYFVKEKKQKIYLWFATFITGIFALFFSIINIYYSEASSEIILYILKKPFAILGILTFIIIPQFASDFYIYFLTNKLFAIVLFLSIVSVIVFFAVKKDKLGSLLNLCLFILIIFFPRIFMAGGPRINVLITFWMIIILYYLLSQKDFRYIKYILQLYLVFIISSSLAAGEYSRNYEQNKKVQITQLANIVKKIPTNKLFIILANFSTLTYEFNYRICKRFDDLQLNIQPLNSGYIFQDRLEKKIKIGYRKNGNEIIFYSKLSDYVIYKSYWNRPTNAFKIKYIKENKLRGFDEVSITLPRIILNIKRICFYNGENWEFISE